MKSLTVTLLLLLILTLNACAVKQEMLKEVVNDTIEVMAMPAMHIEAEIPQGAFLTDSAQSGRFAVFSHEDYVITQEIFAADSWDEAFVHVTGRTSDMLNPILAGNFPQEEYRCTWMAAGENETQVFRCTILYDGSYYYAMSVQCSAEKDREYAQTFASVLASVSLSAA